MERLPRKEIADAFALSQARGANLLFALAGSHIWRGDLSAMRDDVPHRGDGDDENAQPQPEAIDTLLLARAVEMLPPSCRSALADAYAKRNPAPAGQMIRDGGIEGVNVSRCEDRLTEIFSSLRTSEAIEQVPRWVLARENGAIGGHRPQ
jgi:hypothetical protein